MYYSSVVSSTYWDDLANWFDDEALTVPAASLPASGDSVIVRGDIGVSPSEPVVLAYAEFPEAGSYNLTNLSIHSLNSYGGGSFEGIFNLTEANVVGGTFGGTIGPISGSAFVLIADGYFPMSGVLTGMLEMIGNSAGEGAVTGDVTMEWPAAYPFAGWYSGVVTYNGYVLGCTDPGANNYNPEANTSDGSCDYGAGESDAPDGAYLTNDDAAFFTTPTGDAYYRQPE